MNERERLLAEGPRMAPEPPTADGFVPVAEAAPTPATQPVTRRTRNTPPGLMRLIPIGIFGLVVAANAGLGKYAIWVIIPLVLALTAFRGLRRRRS